jgi:hypothetical protein
VVADDSGELRVDFHPGHGGADIQPGRRLRLTGKAHQSGHGPVSMVDAAYQVIE